MKFTDKVDMYFSSEFSQGGFQKTSKPKKDYWETPTKSKDKKKDYSEQRQKKRGEIELL